jgi:uncharacterized membrane protein
MLGGASGVVASVVTLYETVYNAAAANPFLVWNTLLALVPLALAMLLFRDHVRITVVWWIGVVAWIVFLPNAPYVLTDSIHLLDDIRNASNTDVYFGFLPVYGAFFVIGFASYVLSIRAMRRFLVVHGVDHGRIAIELSVHALCAVGMFLGRFVRLNSWDVVAAPASVRATVTDLGHRFPVAVIVATFVVLVAGTFVGDAVIDAGSQTFSRVAHRVRSR